VLREIWLESGIQILDKFSSFSNGLECMKHEIGCGFYVKGRILEKY
jgi:hypothetical protein